MLFAVVSILLPIEHLSILYLRCAAFVMSAIVAAGDLTFNSLFEMRCT